MLLTRKENCIYTYKQQNQRENLEVEYITTIEEKLY